jgi:hypothetical protein
MSAPTLDGLIESAAQQSPHSAAQQSPHSAAQQSPHFADAALRARVVSRFQRIVKHFEATDDRREYNRPALVRLTFEYARSPDSQDRLLVFFFQSLGLDMLDGDDGDVDEEAHARLGQPLFDMAEFLMANFFLPRKQQQQQPFLPLRLSLLTPPPPLFWLHLASPLSS